jgi:hypothetical protein
VDSRYALAMASVTGIVLVGAARGETAVGEAAPEPGSWPRPKIVARALASRIVADTRDVVWVEPHGIFRQPRGGGRALAVPDPTAAIPPTRNRCTGLCLSTGGPSALALDREALYVAGPAGIWRVPRWDGKPTQLAATDLRTQALALSADYVYWATLRGSIQRAPKAGGPSETLAPAPEVVTALAVDDDGVYFTTWDIRKPGTLMSIPVPSGRPRALAKFESSSGLALAGPYVYFSALSPNSHSGAIFRVPRQGESPTRPTLIAESLAHPTDLFVANGWVYALATGLDRRDGSVIRMPTTEFAEVETLADHLVDARALVQDGERVYWSAEPNRILSLPLPSRPGCEGARVDLDAVIRERACEPGSPPASADAGSPPPLEMTLMPERVVVASGKTVAVTLSIENRAGVPLPLLVDLGVRFEPEILDAEGHRADRPPSCSEEMGEVYGVRPAALRLAPGGRLIKRVEITATSLRTDCDLKTTRANLKKGTYKLRVRGPSFIPSSDGSLVASGVLVVR